MSARVRAMKRSKYASGGKITGVPVPGESVIKEAESENDGFKKGGMIAGGKKLARGGFAKPPRKAFGGPPGGMPPQAMGHGRPGGMPPQAFGGNRPPMPGPAMGAGAPPPPAMGAVPPSPVGAPPPPPVGGAMVAPVGGAVPPMSKMPVTVGNPAVGGAGPGIPGMGGATPQTQGFAFKRGGSAKPSRLASGGSPYSSAGKGGKDAPDKGSECS